MDRELLLEIGREELPASWLPALTSQVGDHLAAPLRAQRLPPDAPVETYSTPRRLTVRVARMPERQTDLEELVNGPPVSAAFKPDGAPTPAARRVRAKARRRGVGARARRDAEGRLPRLPQAPARQGGGRRAARRAGGGAARHGVPEADALGRAARGRPRRAAVRAADPLDPVPLRRPRRAVHHPPQRRRADGPRCRRCGRRRDLRAPLPDDQRPRGPRDQGAVVRRVPGEAARELRHPRARRAAQQDRPRARREGAAARRARQQRGRRSPGCCRRCPTWSSTRRSSPARSAPSSSRCPKKC